MENKEKNPLEGSKKETSFEELTAEKKSSDVMYLDELTEKALEKGIELNLPVLLIGETGTGKTGAIKNVAQKKGVDLIRLNLTGQTGVDEILGKFLVNSRGMYWVDGLLIKAMKEGHWIVFDEINMALPEILSALHSLLDDDRKIVLKERNGELIRPHANFRFFATMNPSDEYTGTKELNKAFLSRFPIIQSVEYSNKEVDIISDRTGLKKQDAEKVAMIAKEIRDLKNKEKISYTCSTRDILAFSKLLVNGFKIQDAFMLSIANKVATKEEKVGVMKVAEFVTGEKMDIGISIDGKIHNFSSFEEVSEKIKESKKRVEDIESINKNLITEMEELKKNGVNEINEIKKELEKIKSETNDDSKEI
ncbi:MAG: AAA family ATPase [Novosphingobium sp.]|nr:AAA family ATPase [Novosphingobium sp.]